jgi:outer membrane protein assembly factor BamB
MERRRSDRILWIIILSAIISSLAPTITQCATGSWPVFRRDLQRTGRSPYKGPDMPFLKWSFSTGGGLRSSPIVGADGTVYVCSNGALFAIDPDGSSKWKVKTDYKIWSSPAIGADGTVYACSSDRLYAVTPEGVISWSFTAGDRLRSSPLIGDDGTIYVGSDDYRLYALDAEGFIRWSRTTDGNIISSPAVGRDGTIYVGSDDHRLYAVTSDAVLGWSYTTGDRVRSSPAVGNDGTVYVGSWDGKLYAVNSDGSLNWSFPMGARIWSSPAVGADGSVYMGSGDGKLYAIKSDGSLKWSYKMGGSTIYSSPAMGACGSVIVGYENKLYVISSDGKLKWSYTTDGCIRSSPALGEYGTVYFGSWDQKLYAIEQMPVAIRITQVGFRPGDVKKALIEVPEGTSVDQLVVDLIRTRTGEVVKQLVATPFEHDRYNRSYYLVDFSSLPLGTGSYNLRLGDVTSYPFRITESVYSGLADQAISTFLQVQKCGAWIGPEDTLDQEEFRWNFWHRGCHLDDALIATAKDTMSIRLQGAWHTSGDYNKWCNTAVWMQCIALALMEFDAYDSLDWDSCYTIQDSIPAVKLGAPDGIPDALDHLLWGMDWYLRMQDCWSEDTTKRWRIMKDVHDNKKKPWRLPEEDTDNIRWPEGEGDDRVIDTHRNVFNTLRFASTAALCCQAYRNYSDQEWYDEYLPLRYLARAESARAACPAWPPEDHMWDRQMAFTADIDLWMATGDTVYGERAMDHLDDVTSIIAPTSGDCQVVRGLALLHRMLPVERSLARELIEDALDGFLADSIESLEAQDPFGVRVVPKKLDSEGFTEPILWLAHDRYWISEVYRNAGDTARADECLAGALPYLHWILGQAPLYEHTYVTGLGCNWPVLPLHKTAVTLCRERGICREGILGGTVTGIYTDRYNICPLDTFRLMSPGGDSICVAPDTNFVYGDFHGGISQANEYHNPNAGLFSFCAGIWDQKADAPTNCPPLMDSIQVKNIAEDTVEISWSTNVICTSELEVGLNPAYEVTQVSDMILKTAHSITLGGLEPGRQYHYRVRSRDEAGRATTSRDRWFRTPLNGGEHCLYYIPTAVRIHHNWVDVSDDDYYIIRSYYCDGTTYDLAMNDEHYLVTTWLSAGEGGDSVPDNRDLDNRDSNAEIGEGKKGDGEGRGEILTLEWLAFFYVHEDPTQIDSLTLEMQGWCDDYAWPLELSYFKFSGSGSWVKAIGEFIEPYKEFSIVSTIIDRECVYPHNGLVVIRVRAMRVGDFDPLFTDVLRLAVHYR